MSFLSRRPKNTKQILKYAKSREVWESTLVMLLANIALLMIVILSYGLLSLYRQVLFNNNRVLTVEPFYLIIFLFIFSILVWFTLGLHQGIHIRKNKTVSGFWITLFSALPLFLLIYLLSPVVEFTQSQKEVFSELPKFIAVVSVMQYIFYTAGLRLRKKRRSWLSLG
ncbi:MAG: hypothetical protein COT81_05710 [Candidatus Buchananbacteria bacterium CG10_big_fil_rev_8_21_14_0_10_42_9]|uniref:Uncharacterized protein n=1 Tax=Candidatus Buchananbacteria bacterium CG10_big_fil_rev_8_21_14_0_10_42_9 TaxID=1974526 RepID=A0A2H0VZM1_9BACT|nr:MAG: hypothetical protein COT81_05710 [Candidatus Buchananbacteria bacterium CG10_big_fil_rev_8_21_14_0_10_42_9]